MTVTTTVISNEEQMVDYLSDLIEQGIESAVYSDVRGHVGLIYPKGEYDVDWYTVDSDPYDIEHAVDGITLMYDGDPAPDEPDLDHTYIRVDLNRRERLARWAYWPVTLMHESREAQS